MAKQLTVEYDEVGDILYLDIAPPGADHVMQEVAPGALLRKNAATGAIEGVEIHHVSARSKGGHAISLPVSVTLDSPGAVAS